MASYVDRMQLARAFVNSSGEVVVKLPSSPVFLVLSDPLLLASLDACSDTYSHAHKGGGDVRKLQANHSNPVYQQLCTHSVGHQAHAMVQVGTWDVQIQKFHSCKMQWQHSLRSCTRLFRQQMLDTASVCVHHWSSTEALYSK
jgi:hypothetical protein